jgi:tetratricopeptide (TPR) repeat protein
MMDQAQNGLRMASLAAILLLLAAAGCQTNTSLREDGQVAYNRGGYALARDYFHQATDLADNDYRSYYWLGKTQLELNKPVAAQISLERAQALRSGDARLTPDILDALAEAYYCQERFENLHAFLQQATVDYATSRDFLRQGKYLARMDDVDGAQVAYRKATYFAAAGDAEPYLAIADFYHQFNDLTNEQVALRYAYYVNPKHPGLAERLRRLGTVPGPTVALEPPKPQLLR